ncbi:hypothetical protein [Acidomonas methanolica]|uniref:hypothetical protein n=1 Tax=Acidomonas methanolica TaxID=437 RepID=UPI00104733B6|nr:hypothetical protein [Acidomonas methanolica]MBU2655750.1 hypothetical protein [Acidomonas methanolica]TCS15829.1 hypothetical protein EDC31_1755 [Acidomonas methanolica]
MDHALSAINKKVKLAFWIFHKEWQIIQCLLFKWKIPRDTSAKRFFSNHNGTIFPYIILSVLFSGFIELFIYHMFVKNHTFRGWWIIEDLNVVSILYILSIFKSLFFFRTSITRNTLNIRNGLFFNASIPLNSISVCSIISGATNNGETKVWKLDHPNIRIETNKFDKNHNPEAFEFRLDKPTDFLSYIEEINPKINAKHK